MKVCKKCGKEFKDAYEFCPQCGISSITNKKVKTPTRIKGENNKLIFTVVCIIVLLIIIISVSNNSSSKEKTDDVLNKINEEINYDSSSKTEYENANYIVTSLVDNNSYLKNNYETIGIEKEEDGLVSRYISDDSSTVLTIMFNEKQELTNLFIIYDINNSDSVSDAYEVMTSDILNISDYGKSKIKEILDTPSSVDKINIDSHTVEKLIKTNLYVTINNPSNFSDLISKWYYRF